MDLPVLTFALMALVVIMTPGPTVFLALSNGPRFGFARSAYGVLGAAVSDAVLISAAALGLGAVLAASAFWFTVVKWIGVAYLIWLGAQMLRSSGDLGPVANAGNAQAGRFAIFRKSFLVAVTNPKGYLFFTAFLPQFIVLSQPVAMQYLTLALIFIALDIAVMAAYAGLGSKAMRFLSKKGALWIERTCGSLLVAMGLALAFMRRSS
ncbi:MAG: LysE family translocator [Planktotalea sp.]|uniref:LysE family translocator n=1 Tax=Planktotalea sp. TaxID=2029877 RepID=UPI003C724B71